MVYVLLLIAAFAAGIQNALAGGGSFITFPALLMLGMPAQAANITSTVALFPGQVTTALANRGMVGGIPGLGLGLLAWVSLAGGLAGAVLLLVTPARLFDLLVPFLVLFATLVFTWGSYLRRPGGHIPPRLAVLAQFLIAVYGGYFGGGMGLLMMAALTLAGFAVRPAGATKNLLASVINGGAVLIFAFSSAVHWLAALDVAAGAIGGGYAGALLLTRVRERWLKQGVIAIGIALTIGMFWRAYGR